MEPELVRSFSACLKSMRTWFDSTRFHLSRNAKTGGCSGAAFTCAGGSAKQVSTTKQGRKKQALPSPVCRHGEIGDRAALPTQRMRVQGLRFAPVGPKPRSTGPRGPRCLLLSRFSSAGRASALQAEGPRFDPWNRDDGSFPIRLGESTPLTRRPKGKSFDAGFRHMWAWCNWQHTGLPNRRRRIVSGCPLPAVMAQWQRSCFVNSRFPVQVRMTACGLRWRGSTAAS